MLNKHRVLFTLFFAVLVFEKPQAQLLSLKDAISTGLNNYASIKARSNYLHASRANEKEARSEYLPDLSVGLQQAYGTANGSFGPLYGLKGLNVASSGPTLPDQNWNAAFGSIYVSNVNWDVFAFGRARQKVEVAHSIVERDASDLEQEQFQQQVRIASAYLNLLAAQRLMLSQEKNLQRAAALRNVVVVRVKNQLNAGVDSSLANAEVSNARIALTNAQTYLQEQASQLAQMMGTPYRIFELDTSFITRIPSGLFDTAIQVSTHPVLKYYQNRIAISRAEEKYLNTFKYPTVSLFGVMQERGSGFNDQYGLQNQKAYSHSYWTGINPARGNYLVGVGVTWNLTSPLRVRNQVTAQQWTSRGLQEEYNLVSEQLEAQKALAEDRIRNALRNYTESPVEVKAASDAYLQKTVLYRNGLANIVDVTQALYTLNRAETNRDIIYTSVWQALLQRAAAAGDFSIFLNQL